jgi:hypothetical protein
MTMAKSARKLALLMTAVTVAAMSLLWSGEITPSRLSGLVTQAQAIIGMPLTPMSYAGVARRSYRRGW